MITLTVLSFLVGAIIPVIYLKYCKKLLIIKRRHVHHTTWGLLSSIGAIFLIIYDLSFGIYVLGFGLGLMINHKISEKNFKLITKE